MSSWRFSAQALSCVFYRSPSTPPVWLPSTPPPVCFGRSALSVFSTSTASPSADGPENEKIKTQLTIARRDVHNSIRRDDGESTDLTVTNPLKFSADRRAILTEKLTPEATTVYFSTRRIVVVILVGVKKNATVRRQLPLVTPPPPRRTPTRCVCTWRPFVLMPVVMVTPAVAPAKGSFNVVEMIRQSIGY